jgi:5-methylcytosine-specific restriction endonuclease McrA
MPDNIVLACLRCNNEKGAMDVETYRWFVQDRLAAGERIIFFGETVPQLWYL